MEYTWRRKEKKASRKVISNDFIEVFGAREHNLKGIDIRIPKNHLVVFTGVSGERKIPRWLLIPSYNEGQRRYMESFSAYARQFVGDMERPDVDKITGFLPSSPSNKTTNKNPRSTVGMVTEIYDFFLRLLFAPSAKHTVITLGRRW